MASFGRQFPLDGAPGGTTDLIQQLDGVIPGMKSGRYDDGAMELLNTTFIPVVSALDVKSPERFNVYFNVSNEQVLITAQPPFVPSSALVGSRSSNPFDVATFLDPVTNRLSNQIHVGLTYRTTGFLLYELITSDDLRTTNPVSLSNRTYNFGKSGLNFPTTPPAPGSFRPKATNNIIDYTLNVENTGQLWVNRNGKVGFTDVTTAPDNANNFIEVDNADDINADPDDIDYNFTNCNFQNTPIAVKMSAVITGDFDWRNVNLLFNNCVFTNPQALKAERGYYTLFSDCTLTNANIDVANTYWLNVRNTKIRSTNTTSAAAIRGIDLGHFWFREDCLIDNWGTGIDLPSGLNWNIIMTDGSTIQRCGTGINLNGSVFNGTIDLGILHMDCARMIQNGTAIRGRDIIFSAYERFPNFNTFTKSPSNPSGRYIESVFENRVESDLWLHGNYWDAITPPSTPVNTAWWFFVQPPQSAATAWNGTFHLDNTRTDANDPICGEVGLRGEREDPLSKRTIVKVNGVYRNIKIQYDAAFKHMKEKKVEKNVR